MSTGPTTQSKSLQENESPARDGSAIYYLFQEVSKLTPPARHSFIENKAMRSDNGESKQCSSASFPQVKHVQSPLKLLNLINQQCERLRNQDEAEEQDHCPLLMLGLGNSDISLTPHPLQQLQDSGLPLNSEKKCARKSDYQDNKGCSSKDSDACSVKTVLIENTESDQPEKMNTVAAPQTPELKFSVALDLGSAWTEEYLSTQCSFYDFLPGSHSGKESNTDGHLTYMSNDAELPLDHNANVCLSAAGTLTGPLKSEQSYSSCQQQSSDAQVNTASTCEDSSEELSKPSAETSVTHSTSLEKDDDEQCTGQGSTWSFKKRRKQPRPSRSASVQDPDFQGVTFRMDTELDDSKEQCRLLITSKYSTDLPKNVKRLRLRSRSSQKFHKTSSDEDSDSTSDAKSKVCASCCTSKTPMWRDAEDGTPLCNACGIRYKKYRVRCTNCWHIPKKDGNSVSRCSKCGHFVRLTFAQRRPTI